MDMPTSALTGLTLKDLFDAGLHFGHQTKRWNPKMKPYIFDKRNGIHIIDLTQTVTLLDEAAEFLKKTVLDGKKILFVATKKQAQEIVKDAAEECGQPYMTERWLGGTLTNATTIRGSVKRMRQIQAIAKANNGELSRHKQEASMLRRELTKLEKNLTGIADMSEKPGAIFIIDVCREANAVKEAARLHVPIVALTDTNADPEPIDYVIPGNDDSVRGREDAEKAERAARREKAAADKKAAAEAKGDAALKAARSRKSGSVATDVKQVARKAKEAAEAKAKAELAAKRQADVAAAEQAVAAAEAAEAPKEG